MNFQELPGFVESERRATAVRLLQHGFTLIEMIGVLAIIAILLGVIISTTPKRLDVAAWNLESTNLVNFATALQNSALRYRYIPGATGTSNWVQMIAAELGADPFNVQTNARNSRRVLMIDPANSLALPYSQTLANPNLPSLSPPNIRLMILSTLGPAFPTSFTDGATTDFNTIWTTPDGTLPAFSGSNPLQSTSWNGSGSDLLVQRINFNPLFVHLALWNYPPSNPAQGLFQLDAPLGQTNYTGIVPNGPNGSSGGTNLFLIQHTILSLLFANAGVLTDQLDQVLSRDSAFYYIGGAWRGTLDLGRELGGSTTTIPEGSKIGASFTASAAAFMTSAYNPNATAGETPPMVVNAMSNYMVSYNNWAASGYPTGGATNVATLQIALITAMDNLANNITAGACTNPPAQ